MHACMLLVSILWIVRPHECNRVVSSPILYTLIIIIYSFDFNSNLPKQYDYPCRSPIRIPGTTHHHEKEISGYYCRRSTTTYVRQRIPSSFFPIFIHSCNFFIHESGGTTAAPNNERSSDRKYYVGRWVSDEEDGRTPTYFYVDRRMIRRRYGHNGNGNKKT